MNANKPNPRPRGRTALVVGLLLALIGGGALLGWWIFSDPQSPWWVRWRVGHYLRKMSGKRNFSTNFRFPSKQEMAKAPAASKSGADAAQSKGGSTGLDFETLVHQYYHLETDVILLERDIKNGQADLARKEPPPLVLPTNTPTTTNIAAFPTVATNLDAASLVASNLAAWRERISALEKTLPEKQKLLESKNKELEPIIRDLWAFQRIWAAQMAVTAASDSNQLMQAQADFLREIAQKFDAAINYGTMYELIGQELWVAGRLFGSANPMHRMVGLRLVRQACRDTLYHVQNPWLAARICEGYIWPNLDITDHVNGRAVLGLDNVLNDCADIFRQAEEDVKVVQNYQLMLAALANTPRVDWARFQLSSAYERAGNYREAVHYLKEIKATNNFGWAMRRLPTLEQRAKAK